MKSVDMRLPVLIVCFFTPWILPAQSQVPNGPYFGAIPTDSSQLLFPTLLTTPFNEYNGSFSSDGQIFVFTTDTPIGGIITLTRMQADGSWEKVKVAPFSGRYSEYDPLISPDDQFLYFSSERPRPGESKPGQTNIWRVPLANLHVDPEFVELTNSGDYHSSVTKTGKIYFNTWSSGDIRVAVPSDTGFSIDLLPDHINQLSDVGDPFISPDEDYLIFRGYGGENLGRGDLYISFHQQGKWSLPQNLGDSINSSRHEMCPVVTPDGKIFIFASDKMDQAYNFQPGKTLETMVNKYGSIDNGKLNLYFRNTSFIDRLRSLAKFP